MTLVGVFAEFAEEPKDQRGTTADNTEFRPDFGIDEDGNSPELFRLEKKEKKKKKVRTVEFALHGRTAGGYTKRGPIHCTSVY